MNNKNRYILFYSNNCPYSKEFLTLLYKSPLYNEFIKLCIEDANVKNRIPKNILSVPTIIMKTPDGKMQLEGTQIFEWFNSISDNAGPDKINEPGAFSPLEMGSYSDGFSFIESTTPMSHSFSFVGNDEQKINTPQEIDDKQTGTSSSAPPKTPTDKAYDQMMMARNSDTQPVKRV
jgi:hypothetical protein